MLDFLLNNAFHKGFLDMPQLTKVIWILFTGCLPILAFCDETHARPKLIIDCDTANEIDDHYAIVRMMCQDRYEVMGLTSAQWFHYLGDPASVEASQVENERLLALIGREDLPAPMGASRPMGKPWGGTDAKDSPAAQFIIQTVRGLADDERLTVVCTGATTNIASAIKLAPEIAPKVRLYLMGFRHDPKTGVWNKSEFNIRRDLNAADFLLNHKDVEMHVMSATVCQTLRFDRTETKTRCEKIGKLGDYLVQRWNSNASQNQGRIMWDLALVEAMLVDDLATEKLFDTPPENTSRQVFVYDTIDVEAMEKDFWETVTAHFGQPTTK